MELNMAAGLWLCFLVIIISFEGAFGNYTASSPNGTIARNDTEINGTADATATWDTDDPSIDADDDNTTWIDGGCVNVSDTEMVRINATGSTPTPVGPWTLMRWGFIGNDWMCDLRGSRLVFSDLNNMMDTLRVTTGPNGQMAIGHTQMRCNAKNKPMCNPWKPPRRPCDHNQPANLCFRLLVNCDGTRVAELEEELESLRGQKWILFGYGVLSGFVIGCIVTAVGMMCIDGCCDDSNKQSGSGGGEPRFRRVIETE